MVTCIYAQTWKQLNETPFLNIIGGDRDGHQLISTDDQLSLAFMEYDPVADTWQTLPVIPGLPRFLPDSFIIDNVLYYFGGGATTTDNAGTTLSTMYKYDMSGDPTALNDSSQSMNKLELSPNTAKEILNVDQSLDLTQGNNTYGIYDMAGNRVHYGKISKNQIRLTALPFGNYLLTIRTENAQYSSSFFKIK